MIVFLENSYMNQLDKRDFHNRLVPLLTCAFNCRKLVVVWL